jgi:hypothetical protein
VLVIAHGLRHDAHPGAEVAGQLREILRGDAGVGIEQADEIVAEKHDQLAGAGGAGLGRARRIVEQRQFAEEGAGPKLGDAPGVALAPTRQVARCLGPRFSLFAGARSAPRPRR